MKMKWRVVIKLAYITKIDLYYELSKFLNPFYSSLFLLQAPQEHFFNGNGRRPVGKEKTIKLFPILKIKPALIRLKVMVQLPPLLQAAYSHLIQFPYPFASAISVSPFCLFL